MSNTYSWAPVVGTAGSPEENVFPSARSETSARRSKTRAGVWGDAWALRVTQASLGARLAAGGQQLWPALQQLPREQRD